MDDHAMERTSLRKADGEVRLRFVTDLPKGPSGKVQRMKLVEGG